MKTRKFKARVGAPFSVHHAQKIGEELEQIKAKSTLTPENVVERAKDKKSILHQYFDWDNTEAAEKWRLSQARNITNHIMEIIVVRGEEIEEKAYFNVTAKNDENIYVSLSEAITTPSYKRQLLKEMESTLENLLRIIKLFSSME
jgi:hypothetical protein